MVLAVNVQTSNLDLPTLSLVAVCIAGLLGVFLIIDWMQQRNVRALAWWGSAYLMGASGIALASMPTPLIELPRAHHPAEQAHDLVAGGMAKDRDRTSASRPARYSWTTAPSTLAGRNTAA